MSAEAEAARRARSAARLAAVQALFQMESSGADWREVRDEFTEHRFGEAGEETLRNADPALFALLLEGAVNRQAEIDQTVDEAVKDGRPIQRMDPTLRALFRAAGAELWDRPATPPKVVISEFVEIARAFFPEGKEGGLTNAVLDRMARRARPGALA